MQDGTRIFQETKLGNFKTKTKVQMKKSHGAEIVKKMMKTNVNERKRKYSTLIVQMKMKMH